MASIILHSFRLIKISNRIILLIFLLSTAGTAFSLTNQQRTLSGSVVDCILSNQYEKAFSTINQSDTTGKDPLPFLLKMAVIGMRDVDFEKIIDSTLFLETYEKTEQMVEAWENENGLSSYSRMLAGMCRAIHATFYLRQKKYFGALQHGLDAIKIMKEAQELDSLNTEVDFFLGLYEYARAELRAKLWWVLFWYGGNREAGIQRIKRCAEHAVITGKAARLSLCDIYLKEKDPALSEKNITILKTQFPESRFVLWSEVKYFEEKSLFTKAASAYHQLSRQYAAEKYGTYNELFSLQKMAEMLVKADDKKQAKSVCEKVLNHKNINDFKKIKKETKNILEHCNAS